jgi:5-bromo-4-chloroindolyl phosphate hydrolysis protein
MRPTNWILAAVLAVAVFLLLLVLVGNAVAAGLGAAAGFLSGLFLSRKGPDRRKLPGGLDPATVGRDLAAAGDKIKRIGALAGRIAKPDVQRDAKRVVELMERILEDLYRDPSDIKRASTFLAYHVDATLNVFGRYVELSEQNLRDPGLLDSLRRSEGSFKTMAQAYERLLAGLMENDLLDLDVEIKTLEGAFRAEGVEIQAGDKP